MTKEKLLAIEEIHDLKLANVGRHSDKAQLGMKQMLRSLMGYGAYDGYKITTSEQEYLILIDNGQCCCESWGYFSSEDDFGDYIGKNLPTSRSERVSVCLPEIDGTTGVALYTV